MSIWTRFLGCSSVVERRPDKPVVVGSNPIAPTISRRAFLSGAATVAVAAPSIARTFFGPPRGGWPLLGYDASEPFSTDVLRYKVTERYSAGWVDPRGVYGSSARPMTASQFRAIVEPELNKIFSEVYDNHSQSWEQVFSGDGVSLNSAAHPGSEPFTEEDRQFVEAGGWKCAKGHPFCNCCAGSVLSEESLERLLIDVKKEVDRTGKRISLDPTQAWFIKPEHDSGLKRFERQAPLLISSGRRWWK